MRLYLSVFDFEVLIDGSHEYIRQSEILGQLDNVFDLQILMRVFFFEYFIKKNI